MFVAIVLSGCAAGPRVLDAQVRTHSAQPPGAAVLSQARYRFERGQPVAGQAAPDKLEAMAQAALARVGVLRDDARPSVSVQVGGGVSAYWRDDWGMPYGGWSNPRVALGIGGGRGWRGGGLGFGFGFGAPLWDTSIPAYATEVSLLMRDLGTGQIVYDTRARHDGPWHDTDNVLAALFVAALEGYPQPPQGVRRVGVSLLPAAPAAPGVLNAPAPEPVPIAPPR